MKLPNGFGSVYKLPGNRRKPWAVRITISRKEGKDGLTHWKYKYLGYYESQAAALTALTHYNENPYDMNANIRIRTQIELTVYRSQMMKSIQSGYGQIKMNILQLF